MVGHYPGGHRPGQLDRPGLGIRLDEYAHSWLAQRLLAPRTVELYRGLLTRHIVPVLGKIDLNDLSPRDVRAWHSKRASFYTAWLRVTATCGPSGLRYHDLRHTGATLAAATGASTRELMARLGHASADAALRYQHATADRDQAIARALSDLTKPRDSASDDGE